jgi:hypothetical protein
MKKILVIVGAISFLSLAPHALAQFVPLTTIPGVTDVQPDPAGITTLLNSLYKYLIGVAAVLAVIEIIWGGIEISTESVSKKNDGKERIGQAIFGLVLILSPVLVFTIINPSILNLSISMPPLILKTGPPANIVGGTAQSAAQTVKTSTGCTLTGGNYFIKATCPTQAAATSANCPSGMQQGVLPCNNVDQNGNPLCTTYTSYCQAAPKVAYVWQYYNQISSSGLGGLSGTPQVVPRDAAAVAAFQSGCSGNGGNPGTIDAPSSVAPSFVAVGGFVVSNGCPSDAGQIQGNASSGTIVCRAIVVGCAPP